MTIIKNRKVSLFKKSIYLIPAMLLFLVTSCKPDVKSETVRWESNKKQANEVATLFPAFINVLKADYGEATAKWAEAEKIKEEEKKAEAMQKVNKLFSGNYISNLVSVKNKLESINKKKSKIYNTKMTPSDRKKADRAIESCDKKVEEAKALVPTTVIKTKEEATKIADEMYSKVSSALRDLKSVLKKKRKKRKRRKK